MKLLGDQRDDCGGVSGVQLAVGSHIRFKELADIDLLEVAVASPDTADRTYRRALEKMRKALSK